jgi:hypothetical protein
MPTSSQASFTVKPSFIRWTTCKAVVTRDDRVISFILDILSRGHISLNRGKANLYLYIRGVRNISPQSFTVNISRTVRELIRSKTRMVNTFGSPKQSFYLVPLLEGANETSERRESYYYFLGGFRISQTAIASII